MCMPQALVNTKLVHSMGFDTYTVINSTTAISDRTVLVAGMSLVLCPLILLFLRAMTLFIDCKIFFWNVSCIICSIFKLASSTWQSAFRASPAISVTWSFIEFNYWLTFFCQLSTYPLRNIVATSDFWHSKIRLLKYSHTDVCVNLSFQFIRVNVWRWELMNDKVRVCPVL